MKEHEYTKDVEYTCAYVNSEQYGQFTCGLRGNKVRCCCINLGAFDSTKVIDNSDLCPACLANNRLPNEMLIRKICKSLTDNELLQLQEMLDSSSDWMWEKITKICAKKFPKLFNQKKSRSDADETREA